MQIDPECFRMFQNVLECAKMHAEWSRMIQNDSECSSMFQNVPKCSRMHAECSRMHAECSRVYAKYSRMHAECSRMYAECSRMHAERQNVSKCMQVHELTCSSLSLHEVPWTYMKFHELACSSLSLHEVPWPYMKFYELACSFMSLYAVPFFVWAAHKNYAVLVKSECDGYLTILINTMTTIDQASKRKLHGRL